jgi:hypothetical protein
MDISLYVVLQYASEGIAGSFTSLRAFRDGTQNRNQIALNNVKNKVSEKSKSTSLITVRIRKQHGFTGVR